jgi:hypothetical protein
MSWFYTSFVYIRYLEWTRQPRDPWRTFATSLDTHGNNAGWLSGITFTGNHIPTSMSSTQDLVSTGQQGSLWL